MNVKLAALAVGILVIGAVVIGLRHQDGEQRIGADVQPKSYSPPQFTETRPPEAIDRPRGAGVTADIVKRLNESDNIKAFVEYARQHPEQGGLAYASTATIYCTGVRESVAQLRNRAGAIAASNQATANRRLAAIDELERQCQGFGPGDSGIALLHEGISRGDVVLAAKERLAQLRGRPFEEQVLVAKEVASLKDPQVIQALLSFGITTDARSKEPPINYLDGKPFGGLPPRDYVTAWNVALCSFGWDCASARHVSVLEACAREGKCAANFLELLRADYVKHPERWQQVMDTASRLVSVIDASELAAFAPPAAKPSS
jgi:hypothetical protein